MADFHAHPKTMHFYRTHVSRRPRLHSNCVYRNCFPQNNFLAHALLIWLVLYFAGVTG